MDAEHIGDMTIEQLRSLIREEILKWSRQRAKPQSGALIDDLSDFPVDDLGPRPENLTLRREEMYGDDGR
jgi:hypothetical protein